MQTEFMLYTAADAGVGELLARRLRKDAARVLDSEAGEFTEIFSRVRELYNQARTEAGENPKSADKVAARLGDEALRQLRGLKAGGASAAGIFELSNRVAETIAKCAVLYAEATWDWEAGLSILNSASRFASGDELDAIIRENKGLIEYGQRIFDGLKPLDSIPDTGFFGGFGIMLHGKDDLDLETGTYLTTRSFSFMFIPVYPIARYKVSATFKDARFFGIKYKAVDQIRYLGMAPLGTANIWRRVICLVLLGFLVVACVYVQD